MKWKELQKERKSIKEIYLFCYGVGVEVVVSDGFGRLFLIPKKGMIVQC